MMQTSRPDVLTVWPQRLAHLGDTADPGEPFLPRLVHALDVAYPVLRALLGESVVGGASATAREVLAHRRHDRDAAPPTGPAARWTGVAIDRIRAALQATGVAEADAERAALDAVEELLADPASAAEFLDVLRARS